MEDLLKRFIDYCVSKGVLGDATTFIQKLPDSADGIGTVVTEMSQMPQDLAYGGTTVSYQSRAIDVYVMTQANDLASGREKIYAVYNHFLGKTTIDEDYDILSVIPSSPTHVGENTDQKHVFHTRLECKTRK